MHPKADVLLVGIERTSLESAFLARNFGRSVVEFQTCILSITSVEYNPSES